MDRLRRDTLLGLVFFGTMAFLLWATVNLTDVAVDNVRLKVAFAQAGGCEAGTNVMVLGKKIGKVGAIDIDYERAEQPVLMTLLLREAVPLRAGYRILVRDAGVLGGKQVYIEPGPRNGAMVPADGDLHGEVEPGAFEQIGNIAKGEGPVGDNLNGALAEIREFFELMTRTENGGTISHLIHDAELYNRLNDAAAQLNRLLDAMNSGTGAVGRLIGDTEVGDNLAMVIAGARKIVDQLNTEGSGPLSVLINDKAAAIALASTLTDLATMSADLRDGKGMLGRLLRPNELSPRFDAIVANVDTLLANAVDPNKGILGKLTSDAGAAEDFRTILANLRDTTTALTRNEGLIGALINDKDIALRFRRILTQVSRAIEDAREAAPIGNFVQVLLGTF